MTIRVVLVDDQEMVRSGLRVLLEDQTDIRVVEEAADGAAALAAVRRCDPDVVLMDIRMPVLDGLAATRRLVGERLRARVVVLTTYDLDEYVFEALRVGASGFLLKDASAEELVAAVRAAAEGESLLDPAVTGRVISAFLGASRPPRTSDGGLSRLTPRELQVLRALARGSSNAGIARDLVVTEATVKTHVSSLLAKLGLRDRVHAVIHAYEYGLVEPGDGDTATRH
ncbi:MAG: Two component response regulator containing a CheY-like receiver domain and an DNA-binding [Blastococcus sp.]|nr:Two component response regulator containing a CheY-like receiver domain and an DNA-binding [Blastococcus sp.]